MPGSENGDDGPDEPTTEGDIDLAEPVERAYTCSVCGFAMVHETPLLQRDVEAVCLNCGQWTLQSAAPETLLDAAETAADALAGDLLTERQALAYLLRNVVGFDRQTTADAMDSTPSNVDNLQRRATEKISDARRVVDALDALESPATPAEPDERDQEYDADEHTPD